MVTHFLESFDSVRSKVGIDGTGVLDRSRHVAQTLSAQAEAFVALAFGHDIVAPQSYVLDSVACQSVIGTIASAQRIVERASPSFWDARPYPFLLYLHPFQGRTFDAFEDVAKAVFSAMLDGTFSSSMFPDLADHSRAPRSLGLLSAGQDDPLAYLDDWRASVFAEMWAYLRAVGNNQNRRVSTPDRIRSDFTLKSGIASAHKRLTDKGDATSELGSALGLLFDADQSGTGFDSRSLVHGDSPWFPGGPSARRLVDNPATFDQVLEVVDTLYNRVVSNSIGPTVSSYSTGMVEGVQLAGLAELSRAQDAAIEAHQPAGAIRMSGFEIQVDLKEADEKRWKELGSPEVVASLLVERESASWTKSLANLRISAQDLVETGSDRQFRKDWASHLKRIAKVTGRVVEVDEQDRGVLMKFRNFAGETVLAGSGGLLGFVDPVWGAVGAASTPAVKAARQHAGSTLQARSIYRTLGRNVSYPPKGGEA